MKTSMYECEDVSNVRRKGRDIYFFGEVDSKSVMKCIMLLNDIEAEGKNDKEVRIVFCSNGGGCYEGLALYDAIRQSECHIVTIGTGIVASMGLILFLAGDERLISENTRLLSHQVSQEDFSGRSSDFKIEYEEINSINEVLVSIMAERTGQSENKIRKDQLVGDYWIDSEKAKDEGYADRVCKNPRTYRKKRK